MKKALSLILALVMALSLTVPAFAEGGYDLYINDVQVTSDMLLDGGVIDNSKFEGVITEGTVTYTPAKDGSPAKLTLDNVTCEHDTQFGIFTASSDLVIELKGNNTFTGSESSIYVCGNATFIGDGNLNATSVSSTIYTEGGNCTFSMSGTVEVKSTDNVGVYSEGNIYVAPNGGKIIAHGSFDATGAFRAGNAEIVGYKTAEGSANFGETNKNAMYPVTVAENKKYSGSYHFTVGNPDVTAKTVVLIAYPFPVSGSTTITATVEKPEVEYEIVIPSAVTMNEAGVKVIGAASINMEAGKLKNATANTVISYTASGTNFKLSTDESKTMTATYYTDSEGTTALTGDAIVVYKDSALVDPLTKLYVGVTQDAWDAAATTAPGTYTAAVTYNFSAEEVENMTTVTIYCSEGTIAGLQQSYTYPQGTAFSINEKVLTIGEDTFTVTPNNGYPDVKWTSDQFDGTGVKTAEGTLSGTAAYFQALCRTEV